MEYSYLHFGVEFLGGIAMYFMKIAHDNLKESVRDNKKDIELLRESKMAKEDFKDFREELWKRFDKLEHTMETLRNEKN